MKEKRDMAVKAAEERKTKEFEKNKKK